MSKRRSLTKILSVALIALASLLALTASGQASGGPGRGVSGHAVQGPHGFAGHPGFSGHHRVARHDHGSVFIGVGPSFYWGPASPYGYPDPGYSPSPAYWYYCPSAGAYYPNVPSCDGPWVPVPVG